MGEVSTSSKGVFSQNEKRIVAALSLLALGLRIPLALRPESELTRLPYGDDAFYLFTIAKHIAIGLWPTVDGTHLTNGFQPLIVLLYTPIFWLCGTDAWLAVRWTFILNGVIAALTVWAIAVLMRTLEREPQKHGLTAPIAGAAIWTGTFEIFGQMTNGLETGLSSLLLFIALILYAKLQANEPSQIPLRRWVVLGVVLGLAVLSRIDAAMLVAILVIMLFAKRRLWQAMIIGGTAFVVSAPWWIFNVISFGSLMPGSGQAENSWPMPPWENIRRAIQAISDILSLIFYIPPISRLAWALLLVSCLTLAFYRTRLAARIHASFRLSSLWPFLFFSLSVFVYYMFFFKAPHFLARYFQPARMLWSIIVAASASVFWQSTSQRTRPIIIVAALLGLTFSVVEYSGNYFPSRQTYDFYEMGLWANNHRDKKIGMLQSGIVSFIAPNIINLDGKVNIAALRAHQQGRIAEYLRDENFTYIADWKPFIDDISAIARKDNLFFDSIGMIGGIQLMQRSDR